jgi:hypothetical protein
MTLADESLEPLIAHANSIHERYSSAITGQPEDQLKTLVENLVKSLVKFTVNSENFRLDIGRGRPIGSGTFVNREAFLFDIRLAVNKIRAQGGKVTQERVAEAFYERGLLGKVHPVSQIRKWTKMFDFIDWDDLIKHV